DYNYDKDNKLISYDNYQITYDNSFRPINYKNNNLVWFNNKLLSYGDNQYEYDFNGLRNKKITSNGTYEYIRDDGKLIKETITLGTGINGGITGGSSIGNSVSTITYNYGLNGIIGFTLESNNTTKDYYYIKNIFNDVIEIIDDNYNAYAKYSYDIFGKCNIITNVDDIANINPIRYRSYYYDNETGLYYLNTRYYDPETMRFISLDGIEYLNYDTLGGLNLWVYCNNNPVMNVDPNGNLFFSLTALIVGAIVGAVIGASASIISQGINSGWNNINGWQVLFDGTIGAVGGLITASGIGLIGAAISSGLLGFIGSVGDDLIQSNGNWNSIDWVNASIMTATGIAFGMISGPGAQNSSEIGEALMKNSEINKTFKILVNASEKYVAKDMSKRGLTGVFNLYGSKFLSIISKEIPKIAMQGTLNGLKYNAMSNIFSSIVILIKGWYER
ncbi:MAG: RHS repeat-associated core domain-containing protein, partial [Acholeplasmatales bacterium]|nr:RHS repeat-associated core domain-containing protein [Acholeplasmatales bacterium]